MHVFGQTVARASRGRPAQPTGRVPNPEHDEGAGAGAVTIHTGASPSLFKLLALGAATASGLQEAAQELLPCVAAFPAFAVTGVSPLVHQVFDAQYAGGTRKYLVAGAGDVDTRQAAVAGAALAAASGDQGGVRLHFYKQNDDEAAWFGLPQPLLGAMPAQGFTATFMSTSQRFRDMNEVVAPRPGTDVAALQLAYVISRYCPWGPGREDLWHLWTPCSPVHRFEPAREPIQGWHLNAYDAFGRAQQASPSSLAVFNSDLQALDIAREDFVRYWLGQNHSVIEHDAGLYGNITHVARLADPGPMRALAAREPGVNLTEPDTAKALAAPDSRADNDADCVSPPTLRGPYDATQPIAHEIGKYLRAGIKRTMFGEMHGLAFNMAVITRIIQGTRAALGKPVHLFQELWEFIPGRARLGDEILQMQRKNRRDFRAGKRIDPIEEAGFLDAMEDTSQVIVHPMVFLDNMMARPMNELIDFEGDGAVAWMGACHALCFTVAQDRIDERWNQGADIRAGRHAPGDRGEHVSLTHEYAIDASLTGDARRDALQAQRELFAALSRSLAKAPTLLVINTAMFNSKKAVADYRHYIGTVGLKIRTKRYTYQGTAGAPRFVVELDYITTPEVSDAVDATPH